MLRRAPRLDPRALRLLYLNHPRSYPGPRHDWELPRGFRLRTLARGAFVLYLRSPEAPVDDADFLSTRPLVGEESFLLVPSPCGEPGAAFHQALSHLRAEGWWPDVALLLSDHVSIAPDPFKCPMPVVWVLQPMPLETRDGLDFFTLEQSLPQFGRISRRVRRRCRWRRLRPG
jgi:hypothetical protein